MDVCWPYFDPDYENLTERINGPSCQVSIDNKSCEHCTVVKVDSVNKQGFLLQVVQALTDMNLIISKGYISSDAGWFMDVFHVRNERGKKIQDQNTVNHIQQAIYARRDLQDTGVVKTASAKARAAKNSKKHTTIELTGTDRPGLLSEISAVLTDLRCTVEEVHAWSHNECLACVAYISDELTSSCIDDPHRLANIENHLATVINATFSSRFNEVHSDSKGVDIPGTDGTTTNVERRLHQLMLSVHDFDKPMHSSVAVKRREILVGIENSNEKGYSVVSIKSKDRQRLMFDIVCTLTDMEYVIFHASIRSHGDTAFQEYYIRHIDGCTLNTETERQQVIKCIEAAIERRVTEGVRLELRANNRVGLLSDITRILREYGLSVVRADVATKGEKSMNAFYVRNISGNDVDKEIVESIKKEMEPVSLEVDYSPKPTLPLRPRSSFSDMLKSQLEWFSHNFVPIK